MSSLTQKEIILLVVALDNLKEVIENHTNKPYDNPHALSLKERLQDRLADLQTVEQMREQTPLLPL